MSELDALAASKPLQNKMHEAFLAPTRSLTASDTSAPATRRLSISEGLGSLTPRQRKVLSLLSFGFSNKEIGAMMSVAESTIKAHVAAIFQAFNCTNRVQAALIAFSIRQHMPAGELLREKKLPSVDDVKRLSSFFDE